MRDHGAVALAGLVLATGCVGLPPVRTPMPGCYSVESSGWSPELAASTGIRELPRVIGIDADPERHLLVPPAWRFDVPGSAQPEINNSGGWSDYHSADMDGALLSYIRGRSYKPMAGDSMLVQWSGLHGIATAMVTPTATGFEGPMVRGVSRTYAAASARLALTRRDCGGLELVSSARPPDRQ